MVALCAVSASLARIGSTEAEIRPERPPFGSATASTAVILPAATVARTSTSPYCVAITEPVNICAVAVPAVGGAVGVAAGLVPAAPAPVLPLLSGLTAAVDLPVEATAAPGAEFASVVVGSDGTAYALAIEPETGGKFSASILAIAPDSTVLYTTTIVEP